jgi:hypothetical protein
MLIAVGLLMHQRAQDLPPEANLPGWHSEMAWQALATAEKTIYAGTTGVILLVAGLYLLQRSRPQKPSRSEGQPDSSADP